MEALLNAVEIKKHNPLLFLLIHSLKLRALKTYPWFKPRRFVSSVRYVSF